MSAYIELLMPKNERLIIDAGSIGGVITSARSDTIATPEKPLIIILRAGETVSVFGESPRSLFLRAERAKLAAKENEFNFYIDTLDRQVRDDLAASA